MKHYYPVKKVPIFTGYLALIGCLITVSQIVVILIKGDPLCVNQGCEVVESLTTIPQIYFNGAGLAFFLFVYLCARHASRGGQLSRRLLFNLVTAGICAEAVLINFQYYIANTFCWYCLIILALIVLLNVFLGIKQVVRAVFLFCVISVVFASLDFTSGNSKSVGSYQSGIFATRPGGTETESRLHLFFSSTCSHCENVLQVVDENDQVTFFFNPIDQVDSLNMERVEYTEDYSPKSNRALLSALNINEIPVLLIQHDNGMEIIRGEQSITQKIKSFGQSSKNEQTHIEDSQSGVSDYRQMTSTDDGCTVETECVEGEELIPR